MRNKKSQRTGVSTFASRTSPGTRQSLQKSFHLSHPDKIELKKFPFPSENKKYSTHDSPANKDSCTRAVSIADRQNIISQRTDTASGDRTPAANNTLPQWRVTGQLKGRCFLLSLLRGDSFVVVNPPLRQAVARKWGAIWGQGVGLQGKTYAIPTMHGGVEVIKPFVDDFLMFAASNPGLKFLVTEIGCGIAGFTVEQIAPLFRRAIDENLENVYLPERFYEALTN